MSKTNVQEVVVSGRGIALPGVLAIPARSPGVVLFAHGSGSSRHSPRNRAVARVLQDAGFATLLFDLLTEEEDLAPERRFEIPLLAQRLMAATAWIRTRAEARGWSIGYFGASTGAAAALVAAAREGPNVTAVVSRGGRPDLAGDSLPRVSAATLLIVGGHDEQVLELNRQAHASLRCEKELLVVPGATHLFEEPGAMDQVANAAVRWFSRYLRERPTEETNVDVKAPSGRR